MWTLENSSNEPPAAKLIWLYGKPIFIDVLPRKNGDFRSYLGLSEGIDSYNNDFPIKMILLCNVRSASMVSALMNSLQHRLELSQSLALTG